jgi:stalled ribosome alternative rescue factor ArfA
MKRKVNLIAKALITDRQFRKRVEPRTKQYTRKRKHKNG